MTEQQRNIFVKNRKDSQESLEHLREGLAIQFFGRWLARRLILTRDLLSRLPRHKP